ncbi:MAG: ABC transporter ATP-binding protein [Clostridia bacterium]
MRTFNLEEKAGAYCSRLSGGQKQRLFILLAVIHDPDILFFDELSTGLDPVSRQDVWNYVEKLKKQGKTILVSTHYMQEAERICDRVMLVNKGKTVDVGTAEELTGKFPFSSVIELECGESSEKNWKKR